MQSDDAPRDFSVAAPDSTGAGRGPSGKRSRRSHPPAQIPFGPQMLSAMLRRLDASFSTDQDEAIWRPIARLSGSTQAAKQLLRDALIALEAAKRDRSLCELLRRYEIERHPRASVRAHLGLNERQFHRRRRVALKELCAFLCTVLEENNRIGLRVVDPLGLELSLADAFEAALAPRSAATKLEAMLGCVDGVARGRVAARLAVAASRTGEIERARQALRVARHVAAGETRDPRFASELDLAELRVAAAIEDAPRFDNALARVAERAREGTAADLESYADALSEAGQRALWDLEIPLAAKILADFDGVLLRLHPVPARLQAMSHLLWASVHSGNASAKGLAQIEAMRALDVAVRSSQIRIGWLALFFLVNTLFDSIDQDSRRARLTMIRQYAQYLLQIAESGGDAALTHEAKMLLASATWRLNEHARALAILNERMGQLSPRALLVRDLIRAGMFVQLGRSAESFDLCALAVARATQLGRVGHIGIAELCRSRAAAALGRTDDAMQFALTAVDRLSAARDPHHLLAAYGELHALSGNPRYEQRARQLRGELRCTGPLALSDAPLVPLPLLSRSTVVPTGLEMLTPRQREILWLLGEGRTNRAIAGRLRITEKTVDHHVSAVLAKLGLRSRWQVGSVLVRAAGGDDERFAQHPRP